MRTKVLLAAAICLAPLLAHGASRPPDKKRVRTQAFKLKYVPAADARLLLDKARRSRGRTGWTAAIEDGNIVQVRDNGEGIEQAEALLLAMDKPGAPRAPQARLIVLNERMIDSARQLYRPKPKAKTPPANDPD